VSARPSRIARRRASSPLAASRHRAAQRLREFSGRCALLATHRMPPIGVYGYVSATEMDRCRMRYQRYGLLPPQPSRLAYWSTWTGMYTNIRDY
jgi:hypothetical protein